VFPEELLTGNLDIRSVPAVYPQDMEDRVPFFAESGEYLIDLRDNSAGLCHPERRTIQNKIVLHINDQQCSLFHTSHTIDWQRQVIRNVRGGSKDPD